MATEKEMTLPIKDFLGIDHQVDRENISQYHLRRSQNLWEKEVNVLETRGGSEPLHPSLPPNIIGVDNVFRIFKGGLDHSRIAAVHCQNTDPYAEDFSSYMTALPPGVSIAWVPDLMGNWMRNYGTQLRSEPTYIALRFIGYGIAQSFAIAAGSIPGFSTSRSRLEITVTAALDPNITGIEVLAAPNVQAVMVKENANYLWAGYIDLLEAPTGIFPFTQAVVGKAPAAANNAGAHSEERPYSLTAMNRFDGELIPGKTYYVVPLAQRVYWTSDASFVESCYRQHDTNYSTDILSVTLGPTDNCIMVGGQLDSNGTPSNFLNTANMLIAIGETPQTLIPLEITNAAGESTPTAQAYYATKFPKNRPGAISIRHKTATTTDLLFNQSMISTRDMFIRINDDNTVSPVFLNNDLGGGRLVAYGIASYDQSSHNNQRYQYVQFRNFALITSDIVKNTANESSLLVSDGHTVQLATFDFNADALAPPYCKFIGKYQESLLLGGGAGLSAYTMFFSRAGNPFDFTVAGASTPQLQFAQVDSGGESITGFGIFSPSTQTGPDTRLYVGKRSSSYLLTDLPTEFDKTAMLKTLSQKIGNVSQNTITNTPIGTIIVSIDNVYVLRDSGEPMPLGDPISPILKKGDLTRAVCSYHDEQLKLAFYHPDYFGLAGYNNVELWLDMKKTKQLQGKPVWHGPMVGRSVDYVVVEDMEGDGTSYNSARDRVVVDRKNVRVYLADVEPQTSDTQILDFAQPVESILETKDYPITDEDQNWNKLLTRTYWKAKLNTVINSPTLAVEETWVDGEKVEQRQIILYGRSIQIFDQQPMYLHPTFPQGRYVGRTVRKVLSTTDRIGIGGFSICYKVERRRI